MQPESPSEPTAPADDDTLTLDVLLAALDLPPHRLQCFDPTHPWIDAQRPLLVLPPEFARARTVIADRYPAAHPLRAVLRTDPPHTERVRAAEAPAEAAAWCLDPLRAEEDVRGLHGLRAVVERLVGPDGCPWDREQTAQTLRKYLLEETYEAVDAIDRGDMAGLAEELGDLLMHLLMQAALAEQRDDFRLEDMLSGITRKMVRRHPHVFADETVESEERLLDRWEELKAQERAAEGGVDPDPAGLGGVPIALPALQRAQALLGRAGRLGDDAPQAPDAAELGPRLAALLDRPDPAALGDFLWRLAAWARIADLDAEEALRRRGSAFVEALRPATPPGNGGMPDARDA